jgi:hypothetical protein
MNADLDGKNWPQKSSKGRFDRMNRINGTEVLMGIMGVGGAEI